MVRAWRLIDAGEAWRMPTRRVTLKIVAAAPSNLSTASSRKLPSMEQIQECKSRGGVFLAIETTRRRLASINSFLACSASASRDEYLYSGASIRSARGLRWPLRCPSVRKPGAQFATRPAAWGALGGRRARSKRPVRAQTNAGRSTVPAHLVDQAAFFKGMKSMSRDFERNRNARPRNFPLRVRTGLFLGLCRVVGSRFTLRQRQS